jgi:putative transposase
MVKAPQRRALATWIEKAYRVSGRRACRLARISASSMRYVSRKPDQKPLRMRLHDLAKTRPRAGYKTLYVYLRREGWLVNHKRVYRLYGEEGLTLKMQKRRRHRSAMLRAERSAAIRINDQWAMDFMHDTLAGGRSIRVLTAIDLFTRECIALVAAFVFSGAAVSVVLDEAGKLRGALPQKIRVDNGTEFTSKALDHWAYWNHVALDFSRPGKPVDNAFIESFNASVRRECLSQHWFLNLEDAQRTLDAWKDEYNNRRPHSSLGKLTPVEFRLAGQQRPVVTEPENSHFS